MDSMKQKMRRIVYEYISAFSTTPVNPIGVDYTIAEDFISQESQRLIDRVLEIVESKKKDYWHLQWDGIDDPVEAEKRKQFNTEVTGYINSVIDDLLQSLREEMK